MVPDVLYGVLRDEGVTSFFQTPSSFLRLVEYEQQVLKEQQQQPHNPTLSYPLSPLPSLRTIVFGGEELYPPNLSKWVENHPLFQPKTMGTLDGNGTKYVNMYGITETTVHVTVHLVTEEEVWGGERKEKEEERERKKEEKRGDIGIPLSDVGVVILDQWGRLCPEKVGGEMVIMGGGVGEGYIKLEEVTRKKFKGVMVEGEGWRLGRKGGRVGGRGGVKGYFSGDRGRWVGGSLYFMGRSDLQVFIFSFDLIIFLD